MGTACIVLFAQYLPVVIVIVAGLPAGDYIIDFDPSAQGVVGVGDDVHGIVGLFDLGQAVLVVVVVGVAVLVGGQVTGIVVGQLDVETSGGVVFVRRCLVIRIGDLNCLKGKSRL